MEAISQIPPKGTMVQSEGQGRRDQRRERYAFFRMPLHYPRYSREDYEAMPEWQVDRLLEQYGLPVIGHVYEKREFAIGAFVWPSK